MSRDVSYFEFAQFRLALSAPLSATLHKACGQTCAVGGAHRHRLSAAVAAAAAAGTHRRRWAGARGHCAQAGQAGADLRHQLFGAQRERERRCCELESDKEKK